ncbi:MAG: LysM peptidoglycan-binding domain-containing protein [Gudongella sp.]|nr:LysM peptidoglycan-binding domain-containing protein [Gudongella sp.]
MKSKRYVIVNQTRFFTFITLIIAVVSLLLFSLWSLNGVYGSELEKNVEEYSVVNGDTLWEIALKYAPSHYDVRKLVYEIKDYNGLDSSIIHDGDKLLIPLIAGRD